MRRCNRDVYCNYTMVGDHVKATASSYQHQITTKVTCTTTSNIIYLITCMKCLMQYVGETKRRLKDRLAEHQGYVRNQDLTKATGQHFNTRGHSIYDMHITILEHVRNADEVFRKIREKMYINLFNTKEKGMNKISWTFCQLQLLFKTHLKTHNHQHHDPIKMKYFYFWYSNFP